jgi:hypothetical protein
MAPSLTRILSIKVYTYTTGAAASSQTAITRVSRHVRNQPYLPRHPHETLALSSTSPIQLPQKSNIQKKKEAKTLFSSAILIEAKHGGIKSSNDLSLVRPIEANIISSHLKKKERPSKKRGAKPGVYRVEPKIKNSFVM